MNFLRAVIARAIAGSGAAEYAEKRWGQHSGALTLLQRGAVGGLESTDLVSSAGWRDNEFFDRIVTASIVGRLQNIRRVPFETRLISMSGGATGYWVGQSKPIPLSKPSLAGSSLARLKVASIVVLTKEALESTSMQAEARLDADLRAAVVATLDQAFVDSGNAGISGEMPASITNGLSAIASSGDPNTDIAALIEGFAGDLSKAVFIADPLLAAQLALSRDVAGNFSFPDAGPAGGSIIGLPLLTSSSSPRDSFGGQLALVDASGIALGLEGVEISRSQAATLEMSDAPTGASDTPVAVTSYPVNLFENDLVAVKVLVYANWETQRAGSVSICTGCNYPVAAQS